MLALKLALVPAFLALVTLAARRWGASVAGRLAGLPVVTGPILFVVAIEQGTTFAAGVAMSALSAMAAGAAFNLVYARMCARWSWRLCIAGSLAAWWIAGVAASRLPAAPSVALAVALSALSLALWLQPPARVVDVAPSRFRGQELAIRMVAGAALTVLVSGAAAAIGTTWTGLFAVFPTMGTVLSVFSHRDQGAPFVIPLLRGMLWGMFASAAFCLVAGLALKPLGIAASFSLAIGAALLVQTMVWQAVTVHARRHVPASIGTHR